MLAGDSQNVIDTGNINLDSLQKGIKPSRPWNLSNAIVLQDVIFGSLIPKFNIGLHKIRQSLSNLCKNDVTKPLEKLKT